MVVTSTLLHVTMKKGIRIKKYAFIVEPGLDNRSFTRYVLMDHIMKDQGKKRQNNVFNGVNLFSNEPLLCGPWTIPYVRESYQVHLVSHRMSAQIRK